MPSVPVSRRVHCSHPVENSRFVCFPFPPLQSGECSAMPQPITSICSTFGPPFHIPCLSFPLPNYPDPSFAILSAREALPVCHPGPPTGRGCFPRKLFKRPPHSHPISLSKYASGRSISGRLTEGTDARPPRCHPTPSPHIFPIILCPSEAKEETFADGVFPFLSPLLTTSGSGS